MGTSKSRAGGAGRGRSFSKSASKRSGVVMIPARNLRVVVADDHVLARSGIRALLERMKSVSEVYEARNGREAVAMCVSRRPHLALLESGLPGLNGIDAAERIARQAGQTRVVVFTRQS